MMEAKTMGIESVDIGGRLVADRREAVAACETKLAAVKKQRDTILIDKRVAEARVDAGDKRARMEVASLGKQDVEVGRLVLSIQRQLKEAKRWLAFAVDQAATVEAKRASAVVAGARLYEVVCPDGVRKVRHRAASLEALRKVLQPGYVAVGQVFGHAEDGTGGFVSVPGAPSMLKALLEANGDDLIAYLAERGSNNRN